MTKNKKNIIYVVAAVILVLLVTVGTVFALNLINNKKSTTKPVTATETIKTLRAEAEAARMANNKTRAKALLTQASQKLSEQPQSDANTEDQVDVTAQQCMLGVKSACKGP